MNSKKITVIGSLNMDLVTISNSLPDQGETIRGTEFHTIPGGKGANQAVAAARFGAEVKMIGCVGDDTFGEQLIHNLRAEKIDTNYVKVAENTTSGLANIILSEQDNRIIIMAGANQLVTPTYIEQVKDAILNSDYVLIQFEIPKETIEYCLQVCEKHQIPVIVNPAPAMDLDAEYWNKATYITPNETEWKQLFHQQWNDKLIVTKGKEGVAFIEKGKEKQILAYNVEVIDTTGAGDTFNGALAVALAEGETVGDAILFANAASALSVQKMGAQTGMPLREAVRKMLRGEQTW